MSVEADVRALTQRVKRLEEELTMSRRRELDAQKQVRRRDRMIRGIDARLARLEARARTR